MVDLNTREMHTPRMTTKTEGVECATTRRLPVILGSGPEYTVFGTGYPVTVPYTSPGVHSFTTFTAGMGTLPKISGPSSLAGSRRY
jgi:hypothetical protein